MPTQTAADLEMLQALNRDYINSVQAGDVGRFINLRAENVLIRFFGDIAIIHGRTSYDLPDGRQAHGRYTDVWARQGNTWKTISAHVTRA